MNTYAEMSNRHKKEINAFPMQFAFSDKQFEEAMKNLGVKPNQTFKVVTIGMGCIMLKDDLPRYKEMLRRLEKEMQDAIDADQTGEGFIFDMFKYELANHEYVVTGDVSDALDALGYDMKEVKEDSRLLHGLQMAIKAQRNEYYGEGE